MTKRKDTFLEKYGSLTKHDPRLESWLYLVAETNALLYMYLHVGIFFYPVLTIAFPVFVGRQTWIFFPLSPGQQF